MSDKPLQVLDYLENLIRGSELLSPEAIGSWWGGFAEVSQKEFPWTDGLPSCNVNLREVIDGFTGSGLPFVDRTLRIAIYVTIKEEDLSRLDYSLWQVLEALRATVAADRELGGLLNMPILRLDIREVPSPIGTAFVGCRRLEFDASIREAMI